MLVREPGPKYILHGTAGSFIKYGEDPQEQALKNGISPAEANWGKEDENNYGLLHTVIDGKSIREKYVSLPGNYGTFYTNLYQTLQNNAPLKERPEQGYKRKLGNEATHRIELKNADEARLIITFIEMLLKFIYEMPRLLGSTSLS